jgi:hypothetical protein
LHLVLVVISLPKRDIRLNPALIWRRRINIKPKKPLCGV